MITPWGYSVEGDSIEPIITVEQFRDLYADFASEDEAIEAVLASTSAAIRDWCGWHVGPVLECRYVGEGEGRILVLPAMGVQEVTSLRVRDVETPFEWRPSGLVRIAGWFPDAWRSVECEYTAGFGSESIGQVVAQIAANALAASPGVADERAGNVSITYNKTGDGITGGVSLLSRDRDMLAPYRLARAW